MQMDFTTGGTNIYYNSGNVGIGTTNPFYTLDISGNLRNTGTTIINGNASIGKTTAPNFTLDVSGIINANGGLYVNGSPYIGSQWTTTGGTNIYYNSGNVGIGTTNPFYSLDISGNLCITTINSNSILLGNIGIQQYGIDLGLGDTNRGNISNSGKIMYAPTNIDGNSLIIVGKGTNTSNRNIALFDNTTINGNITVNNAINSYTTKTINGTPYTGLVIQKTNTSDFNLSLIDISNSTLARRVLGLNSYAISNQNNGITNDGDHQIIYTHDITSGGLTNCGLTIAPYDTNISGIRLDSNGYLGICKNSNTYSTPLDVGKSAGGPSGIQTRTLQGIENVNSQQVLHIIQPVTVSGSSPSIANVGYGSIYNLTSNNIYDISAGLSIGWSSQTSTTTNTGTTDFLNWANYYNGGYSFHTINNTKNYTPQILIYIDASGNKTNINKYPNYSENTLYSLNFDVSGSGRFVQDCSSLIVKCYNRTASQTTGTRIIFDTDGFVGSTAYSFANTYISAIQDATNSATLNFATNNQSRMTISYNGLVGIGTTLPLYNLDVTGNGRFTTNLYTGNIFASGGFQGNSFISGSYLLTNTTSTMYTNTSLNTTNNLILENNYTTGFGSGSVGKSRLLISYQNYGGIISGYNNYGGVNGGNGLIFSLYTNGSEIEVMRFINNGNLGIGKTVPSYNLDISGSINASSFFINGSAFTNNNPWTIATPNGIWYNGGTYGNYVGINGINTTYTFYVSGTIGCTSSITGASFNATSDYRIKQNPRIINIKQYNLDMLKPVCYHNLKTGLFDFGLIAHEVQEIFPSLVNGNKDDEKQLQTVNYVSLIPILIAEIQELKLQNKKITNFTFYGGWCVIFLLIITHILQYTK